MIRKVDEYRHPSMGYWNCYNANSMERSVAYLRFVEADAKGLGGTSYFLEEADLAHTVRSVRRPEYS